MGKRTLRNMALGGLAGLAGASGGCKTPEQIGYERTFIGESDGHIRVVIDYPASFGRGGVDKVEFYDENGVLLYTDNVVGSPRGHMSEMNREYGCEKIIVRITDQRGNSFTKTFENPTKEQP
ncbi:hypothetical protein J4462_01335 [Candidatus Pacearchaeota archaeon]|nr:hypothetical protein [Candidatus Pacearchaeota archaeon]